MVGLIIVDIQNDYFPGGKMELEGSPEAGQVAGRLLSFARERRLPVFHIQHVAVRPRAPFFLPGSPGVEIHESVTPRGDEVVVQKHFPNSFRDTDLLERLRQEGIQPLVVAGMMTHMCVDATVRAATDYGYECLVAHDACATHSLRFGDTVVSAPDVHASFLAALNGAYGRVLSADEIVAELRQRS